MLCQNVCCYSFPHTTLYMKQPLVTGYSVSLLCRFKKKWFEKPPVVLLKLFFLNKMTTLVTEPHTSRTSVWLIVARGTSQVPQSWHMLAGLKCGFGRTANEMEWWLQRDTLWARVRNELPSSMLVVRLTSMTHDLCARLPTFMEFWKVQTQRLCVSAYSFLSLPVLGIFSTTTNSLWLCV